MSNEKARQQQHEFIRALHDAVYADDIHKVENSKRKSLQTRRKRQQRERDAAQETDKDREMVQSDSRAAQD